MPRRMKRRFSERMGCAAPRGIQVDSGQSATRRQTTSVGSLAEMTAESRTRAVRGASNRTSDSARLGPDGAMVRLGDKVGAFGARRGDRLLPFGVFAGVEYRLDVHF